MPRFILPKVRMTIDQSIEYADDDEMLSLMKPARA
jgi:hypothetical protein